MQSDAHMRHKAHGWPAGGWVWHDADASLGGVRGPHAPSHSYLYQYLPA